MTQMLLPPAPDQSSAPPPQPPAAAESSRPSGSPRGRRIGEISLAALLAAGLASGGTYAAVHAAAGSGPNSAQSTVTRTVQAAPVAQASSNAPDWAATAAAVSPSVVSISLRSNQAEGQGSGVVIDDAGHILTNNHVVTGAGSSAQLEVTLADGRTYQARIVGTDPSTDLAVLSLVDPPTDLTPISIGDSDTLAVGAPVMAVGNPLGLAGTVTTGIVSALNRPVTTGDGQSLQRGAAGVDTVVTNAIQTSAAINPGNSGGALVSADGRLVGINSAIASLGSGGGQSGNIGIGFAIPVNEAMVIAEQLIATGTAQHPYLGVSSGDGSVADGSATRSAAILRSVAAGTPAAQADLRTGDAVIALDGQRVDSSLSLVAAIREQRVGSTVTLTIVRDGARQDVRVTLTARPQG